MEFILNIKKLRVRLLEGDKAVVSLEATGPGAVTAEAIEGTSAVEIVNKDLYLGTLADKNQNFAQLTIEKGYGYSRKRRQK